MSYTQLSESKPKARKVHQCMWCGEQILIGETYGSIAGVCDGDFHYQKWHLECQKASSDSFAQDGEEGFDPWQNERPKERLGFLETLKHGGGV